MHRKYPELDEGLRQYIEEELQKIELSIQTLADASIQVSEHPPANPRKGMVRFGNRYGWEPVRQWERQTFSSSTTEQLGRQSKRKNQCHSLLAQFSGKLPDRLSAMVVAQYQAVSAGMDQARCVRST